MQDILIRHSSALVLAFALALGLAAALIAWLVSRSVADLEAEDRKYKDRLPLGLRAVWLPVRWLSDFIGPLLSQKTHNAVQIKLRKAGLDYTVTPAQFVTARVVCAALVAMLLFWGVGSFDTARPGEPGTPLSRYLQVCGVGALLAYGYPALWLRDRLAARKKELFKTLPFYLDIITLCIEAGLNMQGAMVQAVSKGPQGILRDDFQRVLRDIRAGKPRADSLRGMAERFREPHIASFTSAVIQAENMGMNLGPVMRAQAEQRRAERFLLAEKMAMEAPVKMLFPLIAFIFPCTFMVLFFPIAMKFMESGL